MKAKVIIENDESKVILTPENEFELTVINDMCTGKHKYEFTVKPERERNYSTYDIEYINHNITITLTRPRG